MAPNTTTKAQLQAQFEATMATVELANVEARRLKILIDSTPDDSPPFKKGDWVLWGGRPYQVREVNMLCVPARAYLYRASDGGVTQFPSLTVGAYVEECTLITFDVPTILAGIIKVMAEYPNHDLVAFRRAEEGDSVPDKRPTLIRLVAGACHGYVELILREKGE